MNLRAMLVSLISAAGMTVAAAVWQPSVPDPGPRSVGDPPGAARQGVVFCTGQVDVPRGVTAIFPTRPGRVDELAVEETMNVQEGDLLLRLDERQCRLRVEEAQAAVAAARSRLLEARSAPARHEARLAAARAASEALYHKSWATYHRMVHNRELRRQQQVPAQAAEIAVRDYQQVRAAHKAERQRLAELEAVDPELIVAQAEQELAAQLARLAQAELELSECRIVAPRKGTVLRVLVDRGAMVAPGGELPALWFCPDEPRVVRVEVDQEFARRLAVGQPAEVRDDTHPDLVWQGRVARIADWYSQSRSITHDSLHYRDVRTLECLIELEDPAPSPRIGQWVQVKIFP